MACFVPFNNRNLDISFFVFRPTIVLVDGVVNALQQVSSYTESLGCVYSSIFKSIHGNMIIWYGAWMKRSDEKKEILNATLLSMFTNVSSMAILIDHSFFEAYAGESRDGTPVAKFSTNDIISMNAAVSTASDLADLSYAALALFKSCFLKMEGVRAGVCLKSQTRTRVACIYVWKSLHSCYSWILNTDYRTSMLPYLDDHVSVDIKYDIFRVVYVSSDDKVLNFPFSPQHGLLENRGGQSKEGEFMQD